MKPKIILLAKRKLNQFKKDYDGFFNVIVDNWRGYRFVFDTQDVRQCSNNCQSCPLYQLVKDEKEGFFSAGLYPASQKDKELFGPQKFLNCKTLKQYQDCYVNFLVYQTQTRKEIFAELALLKNCQLIYSRGGSIKSKERIFKQEVIKKVLQRVEEDKRKVILQYFLKQK